MKLSNLFLFFVLAFSSLAAQALTCDEVHLDRGATISKPLKSNGFVTARDLTDYKSNLEKKFSEAIDQLGPNEIWMDLGAGKGRAGIEFLKSFSDLSKAPRVVLVAYKFDRWFPLPRFEGKLIPREGSLFESMNLDEFQNVQVMTDVFGVLSYTKDLHQSLSKALSLLKVGGSLFVRTEFSFTRFLTSTGEVIGFEEFLKSIPGLEVQGRNHSLQIIKRSAQIRIPLFRLNKYIDSELPPIRHYQLIPQDI